MTLLIPVTARLLCSSAYNHNVIVSVSGIETNNGEGRRRDKPFIDRIKAVLTGVALAVPRASSVGRFCRCDTMRHAANRIVTARGRTRQFRYRSSANTTASRKWPTIICQRRRRDRPYHSRSATTWKRIRSLIMHANDNQSYPLFDNAAASPGRLRTVPRGDEYFSDTMRHHAG